MANSWEANQDFGTYAAYAVGGGFIASFILGSIFPFLFVVAGLYVLSGFYNGTELGASRRVGYRRA